MSVEGYDRDELRALSVALTEDLGGDNGVGDADGLPAEELAASARLGVASLQSRGVLTLARDGSIELDAEDAPLLRAFLAPNMVVEAWFVSTEQQHREWYVAADVTASVDDGDDPAECELTGLETAGLFSAVIAFVDLTAPDANGPGVVMSQHEIAAAESGAPDLSFPAPLTDALKRGSLIVLLVRGKDDESVLTVLHGPGGFWEVEPVESPNGGAPMPTRFVPLTRAGFADALLSLLDDADE